MYEAMGMALTYMSVLLTVFVMAWTRLVGFIQTVMELRFATVNVDRGVMYNCRSLSPVGLIASDNISAVGF